MAIDSSIALQGKLPQIESPLDAYAKVAQFQQMQQQNRLADLMFGEKQREVNDSNTLNQLYKSSVGADGQIDRNKLYSGLAQGGLGSKLPIIQKGFADQDKSLLEAQKAKIETGLKQFEMIGQLMSGVKDQATYDAARQQAAQILGPEHAANMPSVYDPVAVEQGKLRAMSVKDQMEQKWKALDYQLNQDKFAETKRSNLVTEGISRGNLGVAQGNLAVSRDRLAFDKSQPKGQYDAERGVLVDTRTGTARPVTGADGQPLAAKDKLTESQGKSTAFAARMQNADSIINDLVSAGTKTPSLIKQGAEGVPLIGGALGVAANKVVASPAQQKMEQAQRDFVNAVLRQESGAAISASEFDNARKQYFPQPGDSPDVIQQKAQNRRIAIEGMKTQSGPGAAKIGSILQPKGAAASPANTGIKFLGFE